VTATLTVSTTAATTSALVHPAKSRTPWYAAGGAALACILLIGIPTKRRSWLTILGVLMLLVTFSGAMTACGGGGNGCSGITQISAAPGTYAIQVLGAGVNSNVTHFQNVAVTITQWRVVVSDQRSVASFQLLAACSQLKALLKTETINNRGRLYWTETNVTTPLLIRL